MHEVKCEQCGRVLGIITDEKILGKPVYRGIETVNFMTPNGFIDGSIPSSSGTTCNACSHSLNTKVNGK